MPTNCASHSPDDLIRYIEGKLLAALNDGGFGGFSIEYQVHRSGKLRVTVGGTRSRIFYLVGDEIAARLLDIEGGKH